MKIITICGSLKYQNIMMEVAQKLTMEGNCVLTPTYPVIKEYNITEIEMNNLKESHLKRIELSDAIYVLNVDNYIGESTKKEIDYATSLNKEIIYYTDK